MSKKALRFRMSTTGQRRWVAITLAMIRLPMWTPRHSRLQKTMGVKHMARASV